MPIVSEVVTHIIHHVDAEDTLIQDPSQKDGVKDRADYVKDAFQDYEDDLRDIPELVLMQEVSDTASPGQMRQGFRRMIANMIDEDEERPRLAIQEWVCREWERRSG